MNHHQEVRRLYKRSFWMLKKKGSKIQNKNIRTNCWLLRTADDKDTDPRCTLYDSWSRRHISWCPRAITRVLAEDTSATLFLQVIHHFRSGSVSHNNNQQLIFLFLVDAVFPKRIRFSVSEETTTTFFATSYQTELTTLCRVQFQSKLIVKVSLICLCSKNLSQQSLEISLRRSVVSLLGQRAGH